MKCLLTATLALLLTGCAGSAPELSSGASTALTAQVARVSAAARSGDGSSVRAAVGSLQAEVTRQQQAGRLSDQRATSILAAAARVVADVPVAAPAVTRSPAPTRTSQAPVVVKAPDHARDGDKRKGKGDGGDHGD